MTVQKTISKTRKTHPCFLAFQRRKEEKNYFETELFKSRDRKKMIKKLGRILIKTMTNNEKKLSNIFQISVIPKIN